MMKVTLEPRVGESLSAQVDVANMLLTHNVQVQEVVLQMNDGLKFMRKPMNEEDVRKYILPSYEKGN